MRNRATPAAAVLLLGLLAAPGALGQGLRATVDRAEATLEDRINLTLTVEGSQSAAPRLPDMPGFDVHPGGRSSQVQIVNGRMKASVGYGYILVPKRKGRLEIPPASVEIDGRVYRSEPISIRILDSSTRPSASRDLFTTATVSNRSPFVGEQVIYTWKFLRRVRIGGANLRPMEFGGLLVEDLGDVREYETTLNGVPFVVSEIRKALFPSESGKVTIPGSELTCEVLVETRRNRRSLFDDFFGRAQTQTKVLRTSPIELDVRPLPPPPRAFSGLVGSFDIDAKVSKRQLSVGESATLELTISGRGNVTSIPEPPLSGMGAFKVYDDKPTTSVKRSSSGVRGSRSFHKAVVPLEPGEMEIPPVPLVYFDPSEADYRTVRTPAIALRVSPAEGPEELRLTESVAPTTGKVAVRILADDILPIHKGLDAVTAAASPVGNGRAGALLALGGLLAPPLAFAGTLVLRRRRERHELDAGLRRRKRALRRALATLREIGRTGDGGPENAARLASRCVREFVGDKLDLEGAALTAAETDRHLRVRGVDAELVRKTHELLDRLEAAQYGASAGAGAGTGSAERLIPGIAPLLRQLDRQIRA